MVANRTPGPPPKDGPREPNGRLRRSFGDVRVRAPTLFQRIKEQALAGTLDRRVATEVGRHELAGEITHTQAVVALKIAETYALNDRYNGSEASRFPRSPAYQIGFRSVRDAPSDPEERKTWERRARRALKRWRKLQDALTIFGARGLETIEALCVRDEPINSAYLPHVRVALDHLAVKMDWGPGTALIATQAERRPALKPEILPAGAVPSVEKVAWLKVMGTLCPHLSDQQIEKAWRTMDVLRDREAFRRGKPRRTRR